MTKINPVKDGDIVSIRLVSGDELVGTLKGITDTAVLIDKPIVAMMQPNGRGEIGLAFAPFMASAEDGAIVALNKAATLLAPVPTRADIAEGYRQQFSPIVMPPKSGIILT